MNNENTKRVCSNCKYFKRHYIVNNTGTLTATATGKCIHFEIKDSVSAKHVRRDEGCDLWQPYELQKLNVQYRIEQNLQNISDKAGEMLAILRDID